MKVKRILSMLLVFSMLFSAIPLGGVNTAYAASATLSSERLTAQNNLKGFVTGTVAAKCGSSTKSSSDNEGPGNLFDGDLTSKLGIVRTGTNTVVITWQMIKATKITAYTLATANDSPERDPMSWTLYGSNNGSDYTAVSTVAGYMASNDRNVYFDHDFVAANPGEYSYYKLELTGFKNLPSDGYPQFSELILSGADTGDILNVAGLIDAIPPSGDPGFNAAVTAAAAAYSALSRYKQSTIYNSGKLLEAVKVKNMAEVPAAYKASVLAVVEGIESVGKILTYRSDKKIAQAKEKYDQLPNEAKPYVYNYSDLQAAEEDYQQLMNDHFVTASGWAAGEIKNTPWLQTASEEEKAATREAFADEIKYQYVRKHYDLGLSGTVPVGEYMGNLRVDSNTADSDNVGNPWGFANGYVALITAPFSGMAFSVNGYFGANYGYATALSDTVSYNGNIYLQDWNGLRYHSADIPLEKDRKVYLSGKVYYPGGTAVGDGSNNTFRYTYAAYNQANKWQDKTFGLNFSYAVWSGDFLYQQFDGPDGTTYLVNTKERIDATNKLNEASIKQNQAYMIIGDMAAAFSALGSDSASRFSQTGAVLGNAYTDTDGNTRQDFELMSIIIDKSTGAKTVLSGDTSIRDFRHSNIKAVRTEKKQISILVKSGADLAKLAPVFTIAEHSGVDKSSGSVQNFNNKVSYTVTAQNGNKTTYVVEAFTEESVTAADQAAASAVSDLLNDLPVQAYRNDRAVFEDAVSAYDALSAKQKLLVSDASKAAAAKEQLNALNAQPIKIVCVGDSITEGVGVNNDDRKLTMSYPGQLETLLGSDYSVINAGVSGTNAINTMGAPYVATGRYNLGLESNPDIVIMMLGTNDAQGHIWNSTEANASKLFKEDYTRLINEYQALASNPKIYLALPMTCFSDSTRQTNNINGTIPTIKQIAAEYGIEVIDMNAFTKNHEDWFPDKLHPNEIGYGYIAAEFKTYVDDYVKEQIGFSLDGIQVGAEALAGFDADKTAYTIKLDTTTIPKVTATGSEGTVTVTAATLRNPVAAVAVKSARFGYGRTYTIIFDFPFILGDMDNSNTVDVSDVVELRRRIVTGNPTPDQIARGDVEQDDRLDVSDVVALRRLIMKGS